MNEEQKKFIFALVKRERDKVEKEGKSIIRNRFPQFLAIEEKYDMFLEELLDSIKEWK